MTHLGKEVSSRATAVICGELDNRGIPVSKVIEGLSSTEAQLRSHHHRMSWEDYTSFLDRADQAISRTGGWDRSAPEVHRSPGNDVAAAIARALVNPALLHWLVAKWMGPSYFRNVQFDFQQTGPNRARFVIEIPEAYRGSIAFFHVWRHGLRNAPGAIGLPEAAIDSKIDAHRGEFEITFAPRLSLVQRLRSRLAVLISTRSAIAELSLREEELKAYYKKLSRVERELLERETQLRISSEMASMARMSVLGEMSGGVAHEINNPLAIILVGAEQAKRLLQQEPLETAKIHEKLDRVIGESKRVAEIVQGLRFFARDAGSDPMTTVSVGHLVEKSLMFCRQRCQNQGIRLDVNPGSEDLQIECREAQIVQVLLNCINNSYDAIADAPNSPSSNDQWIRLDYRQKNGMAEISISDSGPGVPSDARGRVFQPFFTTKKIGRGAGLGLSAAAGIIEAHRGWIDFDYSFPHSRLVIQLPQAK